MVRATAPASWCAMTHARPRSPFASRAGSLSSGAASRSAVAAGDPASMIGGCSS